MKKAILCGAAFLALVPSAMAQTTIINNNNNITVNNGNGNGNFDRDQGTAVNWRNNSRRLEAWLRTDRMQYRPGTGVRLALSLTNTGSVNATYTNGSRGEYQITVTDVRTNRVIWSRDRRAYRGAALKIAAGGTANWTEYWDQRDSEGNAVPSGAYRIDARVYDLPLSTQIFLTDRGNDRPVPIPSGPRTPEQGMIPPDPIDGPQAGRPGPAPRPVQTDFSGLTGNLAMNKTTVQRGDTVRLIYTVVNSGQQTVNLVFVSGQLFDITARLPENLPTGSPARPVWRLSDDMVYTQAMQRLSLAPGERRSFTVLWRIGDTVPTGQALDITAVMRPAGAGMSLVAAGRARLTVN